MSNTQPTAALLIIGNEILSGRTQDKNAAYLAKKLVEHGIRLVEIRVVPDQEEEIITAAQALSTRYTYLFTTGGIGPTHDDITAESIAKACDTTLECNAEALSRLEAHYADSDQEFNEARKKMAYIPIGAVLIDNPISAAPGFIISNIYVMAGVPVIMQAMTDAIVPTLAGGAIIHSRTVTTNLTEGTIATALGDIQHAHPTVDIGSYPYIKNGRLGVSIVLRGEEGSTLDDVHRAITQLITDHSGTILS